MEISKIKLEFLEKLGININNPPSEFRRMNQSYEVLFSNEERKFVYSNDYTARFILPFSMKDICGTDHPDYEDMTFLESFLKIKRGYDNIRKFYSNPKYYTETLKQKDQSKKTASHDTPLELYRLSDGRCVVKGGNNRINIMMMLYLSELSKAKTEEEKEQINEKYTFYAEVRSLPKNEDVYNAIFLLKDRFKDEITFKFIGSNPDDCHYNIEFKGQMFEIRSVEELKNFLFKMYELETHSSKALCDSIISIVYAYNNATSLNNQGKIKLLKEMCPDIEEIKNLFVSLRGLTTSQDIFDRVDVSSINYSNLSAILVSLFKQIKEENELKELDSIKDAFNNIIKKDDIINLMNKIRALPSVSKEKLKQYLPNYERFIFYFNEVRNLISEVLTEDITSYLELYQFVITMVIDNRTKKLETSQQELEETFENLEKLNRKLVIIENKDEYIRIKQKQDRISSEIKLKQDLLASTNQDKETLESEKIRLETEYNTLINKNFFIRIFKRKKIKSLESRLAQKTSEIENKNLSITGIQNELDNFELETKDISSELSNLCGFEISLSEYEKELEQCKGIEKQVLLVQIGELRNRISNLRMTIAFQKSQLEKICSENQDYIQGFNNEEIIKK